MAWRLALLRDTCTCIEHRSFARDLLPHPFSGPCSSFFFRFAIFIVFASPFCFALNHFQRMIDLESSMAMRRTPFVCSAFCTIETKKDGLDGWMELKCGTKRKATASKSRRTEPEWGGSARAHFCQAHSFQIKWMAQMKVEADEYVCVGVCVCVAMSHRSAHDSSIMEKNGNQSVHYTKAANVQEDNLMY